MKITYVGHATVIIEMDGCKFITDPLLVKRIAWIGPKRLVSFHLDPGALDDIDFITVSHGHFDHLDLQSMHMIDKDVPVICHPNLRRIVKLTGHKPISLDWWDSKEINGVKVSAVPSYHLSFRPPFHYSRDYQGYIIETEKTIYHAGDCGMRDYFFREIRKRFKIDVAFLPIGAYYPFRKRDIQSLVGTDRRTTQEARAVCEAEWDGIKIQVVATRKEHRFIVLLLF